jgi:hypothetical protein
MVQCRCRAGGAGRLFVILEEQEILTQFFLIDLIWGFSIMLCQLAHRQQIRFLRPDGKAAQLHTLRVDHLLS